MVEADSTMLERKIYELVKKIFIEKEKDIVDTFESELLDNLIHRALLDPNMNMITNIQKEGEIYIFKGYPNNDILVQLSKIIPLWSQLEKFPIHFIEMAGFTNETDTIIEGLNEQLSPTINSFILKIQEEPDVLNNLEINKIMKSIIMKMGMRGLLTCAGFRKTMGSSDLHIYPLREDLIMKFNEMNVQLTEEEMAKRKSIPKLSVGGRALAKHSTRSSQGFWGVCKGSEAKKNELAANLIIKILQNCVWCNIHMLPGDLPIFECRVEEGYGIRWDLNAKFRGFLEPMMEGGHDLKWRH